MDTCYETSTELHAWMSAEKLPISNTVRFTCLPPAQTRLDGNAKKLKKIQVRKCNEVNFIEQQIELSLQHKIGQ